MTTTPTENESPETITQAYREAHPELVEAAALPAPTDGTAPQTSVHLIFPATGGSVFILAPNSVATGETREVLKLVAGVQLGEDGEYHDRPGFETLDGELFYCDERGQAWRFPTESETEPQRCTVPVTVDGETSPCGTLLGKTRADCLLCKGVRCYVHCGSIDHFQGKLVARGGTDFHEWRTREIGARFFMGQLYRRKPDGELVIVETVGGVPGESHRELFRRFEAVMAVRIARDSQVVLP